MECITEAIFADVPAFSDAGFNLQCLGILADEPFKQGCDDVVFGNTTGSVGIETLRLSTVALVENSQSDAFVYSRFASATLATTC
jgi:hypothetical protein